MFKYLVVNGRVRIEFWVDFVSVIYNLEWLCFFEIGVIFFEDIVWVIGRLLVCICYIVW